MSCPDEVYIGIYLCAHNNALIEKGIFRNVRLIRPAAPDFKPYRDYIGSDIELMDVSTGARRSIYRAEDSLQAPNWTPDGLRLIYNHNGRMFSFDLATGQPAPISTGSQVHCNNDHTLSFDGSMLGISSGSPSIVYTLPIGGGEPTRITPTGPSYLHGWSPDGKYLLFTGERNHEFDIYKVPSAGGPEVRLTTAKGLNDGSEFTPDGKTIFFNSERSGKMQVWRMNADGSGQTQVTDDDYNNWFPHVSPGRKDDPLHHLSPRDRAGRPSLLQARLPAAHAGGRRQADGGRLPLRRPGFDQRQLVVAGRPVRGVRQQLRLVLVTGAGGPRWSTRRQGPGSEGRSM